MIKSKGVNFPAYGPSKYEPAETPVERKRTLPINYSDEDVGSRARPRKMQTFSDDYLDLSDFNEKKKKLYRDLLVVLENIELTNSIINEKGDEEILKTMLGNLNQMEGKFEALKKKLKMSGERELFSFTSDLLQEIMKIYKRANTFSKNRKTAGYYLARETLSKKCTLPNNCRQKEARAPARARRRRRGPVQHIGPFGASHDAEAAEAETFSGACQCGPFQLRCSRSKKTGRVRSVW